MSIPDNRQAEIEDDLVAVQANDIVAEDRLLAAVPELVAALREAQAEADRNRQALALMSSLAINPAIPYGFRSMMRTALGEPPLSPWETP